MRYPAGGVIPAKVIIVPVGFPVTPRTGNAFFNLFGVITERSSTPRLTSYCVASFTVPLDSSVALER